MVTHNAGFFSCCTIRLRDIVRHTNKHRQLPALVDSSQQFAWYRPASGGDLAATVFFSLPDTANQPWRLRSPTAFYDWWQFEPYSKIQWSPLTPFVRRWFTPSDSIQAFATSLEQEHQIDWSNTAVLFYRGNDKATETALPSYDSLFEKGRQLLSKTPGLRFLIQSDETEFLKAAQEAFPNSIVFWDHIRHIPKANTTVDKLRPEENFEYAKKFLAIVWLMSKARYVICSSGNISMWIVLYRGGTDGVYQSLNGRFC